MLKEEMNMIGKMYRPIKISTIDQKRGFELEHKYKSNFGGTVEFTQNIYLLFDADKQQDVIKMELFHLPIPVLVSGQQFTQLDAQHSKENKEAVTITTFRKMERPGSKSSVGRKALMTSKGDALFFEVPITSEKNAEENDWLEVELQPVIVNNQEYLRVQTASETPVEIYTDSSIEYVTE